MKGTLFFYAVTLHLCYIFGQSSEELEEGNLTYPCGSSYDSDCIRNYFVDSGSCDEAHHEDGQPISGIRKNAYFPKADFTIAVTQAKVTYTNPQIRAFYINEDTKNLIFAVEFDVITVDSEYTYFRFHRVAQEPVVVGDYVNATYPSILTAIIPVADGLTRESIETASITGYLTQRFPRFMIGPKIFAASLRNSAVIRSLAGIFRDIPTAVTESLLTAAPYFFVLYLQEYFCDFDISLNSNGWGNTIGLL